MQDKQHKTWDKDNLTIRQKLFAYLYIAHKGNGGKAAREAGYTGDVGVRATRLLANRSVVRVIERERARLVEKAQLKSERVLQELMRIAFFDIRRLFNSDNTLIPLSLLDADAGAVVTGVNYGKGGLLRSIRFANKIQALDLLGRYLKLWQGAGDSTGDRLAEVLAAFKEGPTTIQ